MRIEKRTTIVLTIEESATFERAMELLNRIIRNCDGAEIESLATSAAMGLFKFWRDKAVEIE